MKGEITYTQSGESWSVYENRNDILHDWVRENCKRANEMSNTVYIVTHKKLQQFLDDTNMEDFEPYELFDLQQTILEMKENHTCNYYYEVMT